jgi:hypothetical protein
MKDALGDFRVGLGAIAVLAMIAATVLFFVGRGSATRVASPSVAKPV